MSKSQSLNDGSSGQSASDQNQAGDGDDIGEQLRQSPVYQEIIANWNKVQDLNPEEETVVATKLQEWVAFADCCQNKSDDELMHFVRQIKQNLPKRMRFELERRFRSAMIQRDRAKHARV